MHTHRLEPPSSHLERSPECFEYVFGCTGANNSGCIVLGRSRHNPVQACMTECSAQHSHASIDRGQHASLHTAMSLHHERTHITFSLFPAAADSPGQAATTVTACPSCFSARTCDTAYTPLPLNVFLLYS